MKMKANFQQGLRLTVGGAKSTLNTHSSRTQPAEWAALWRTSSKSPG